MNNLEQAAELIAGELNLAHTAGYPHTGLGIARELAENGLLAPELPELDDGEWEEGWSVISTDDEGYILPDIDNRATHPVRARRIAYALLAAADHAESEGK